MIIHALNIVIFSLTTNTSKILFLLEPKILEQMNFNYKNPVQKSTKTLFYELTFYSSFGGVV